MKTIYCNVIIVIVVLVVIIMNVKKELTYLTIARIINVMMQQRNYHSVAALLVLMSVSK